MLPAGTCRGTVKSYNSEKGYGFIVSPQVPSDVMFGRSDIPEVLRVQRLAGCEVDFTLATDKGKGKGNKVADIQFITMPTDNQAWESSSADAGISGTGVGGKGAGGTVVGGKGAGGKGAASPASGPCIYQGKIKSWSSSKGFGFVTSPQAPADIMFGRNDIPEQLRNSDLTGVEVGFDLAKDSTKGLRCSRLTFSMEPEALANTLLAAKLFGKGGNKGAASAAPAPPPAERHEGHVKSCNPQKGFGFIISPAFENDVWFGTRDLELPMGMNPQGMSCTFEATRNQDGKYRATNIEFQAPDPAAGGKGSGFPGGKGGPAVPEVTPAEVGIQGTVKQFNGNFGFIQTSTMDSIYFKTDHLVDIHPDQIFMGTPVTFDLVYQKDGKPQGRNIGPGVRSAEKRMASIALLGPGGCMGPMDFPAAAPAKRPAQQPAMGASPMLPEGCMLTGYISSYRPAQANFDGGKKGGFGFIRSNEVSGDIWFGQASLPQQMQNLQDSQIVGCGVRFKLKYKLDGKMSAENLAPTGA
eukprot:TRINITY_DN11552_c0_g1_i1.p1 TRINITY_DN11552_c0_g1~~TRINITY_DN11552_c0_g1_i1.p1  ORF type:complete len:549 (-),score=120.47 TRINITY_DN11552_c0_g1_i1:58-1629(-)